MKAAEYEALPRLGLSRDVRFGSVLWICPHRMTPVALEQNDDAESYARKYVAIGSVSVNGEMNVLMASRVDRTAMDLSTPGSSEATPSRQLTGVISLGAPEVIDRRSDEVRVGEGQWTLEGIQGAMYTWGHDSRTIRLALAHIVPPEVLATS